MYHKACQRVPRGAGAQPVNDYELASRLSYFLWSSMPDDELFRVAAEKKLHEPAVLILDEATSALDNETQSIVTRSLETLRATRVVIAHRLSTVVKADRILVFDKGSVVQSGTYEELISQDGLFKDLAVRQLA